MSCGGLRSNHAALGPAGTCSFPVSLSQQILLLPALPPSKAVCATSGTDVSYMPHPIASCAATSAVPWHCCDTRNSCLCYTVALCHHTLRVLSPAIVTPGFSN